MRRNSDKSRREFTTICLLFSIFSTTSSCLDHSSRLLSVFPMSTIASYSPFFTQPSKWSFTSWAAQGHAPLWALHSLLWHLEWNPCMTWQALPTSPASCCAMLLKAQHSPAMLACHQFSITCKLFLMSELFIYAVPSALFPITSSSSPAHTSVPTPSPFFYTSTPSFYPSWIFS